MPSKREEYNLPGCGTLTTCIYDYTQSFIDFLEGFEHITRLRTINQLGRLRDVYPGAHHTRYEYVFLQWTLIHELCQQKESDRGLSTHRSFFGRLSNINKDPSSAEILQCLVLLTNIGYLEGTFSSSRAWLHLMKENPAIRKKFRSGLPEEDRTFFDSTIEQFTFYKFQHLITIFLLSRYRVRSKEHSDFGIKLLRAFQKTTDNNHLFRIFELYKSIRRISYLVLDSFYAPVPFTLDLASIMLGFGNLHNDIFNESSPFQSALKELENVLQNSVYLSPDSIINTSRATANTYEELKKKSSKFTTITNIKNHLCPVCNKEDNLVSSVYEERDWNKNQQIVITFSATPPNLPDVVLNPVKWEIDVRKKLGITKCRLGMLRDPKENLVKVGFSLKEDTKVGQLKTTIKGISELHTLRWKFNDIYENPRKVKNLRDIFRFCLKAIFGWDKRYELQYPSNPSCPPFAYNSGRENFIMSIECYKEAVKELIDDDNLFEIEQMIALAQEVDFSGYHFGFVGATKIYDSGKNTESAEFDGVLILPKKVSSNDYFAYVLEAKNKTNGYTEAKSQLEKRMSEQAPDFIEWDIQQLNNRGVYARLKLK